MTMRIGIIGTGRIARIFVSEAAAVAGLSVEIAYNPNKKSAERFCAECRLGACTDNLEEVAARVDAVYIASPHETHYAYAKWMLNRRVHVLCEKPMVLQGRQAAELYKIAKEKGCVLMEAAKTAYCPGYQAMIGIARSGVIGMIRDVEACFSRLTPTNLRELTDKECGGSFTELGTYPMLPVLQLLGTEYLDVRFRSLEAGNGLDAYTKAEFQYRDACGLAKTGLLVKSEGQLIIAGTKGYILAKSPWWQTREFEVRFEDPGRREVHVHEYAGRGLRYEIEAFEGTIRGEDARKVTPEESIRMAETMERFLNVKHRNKQRQAAAPVKIWAHRGMSYAYPENTLEAFEAAAKLDGLTGIELDVQLTKDGEVVVIHDERVDRTAEGNGAVSNFTLREIQKLKIRGTKGDPARIPTLAKVLCLLRPYCVSKGLLINIELKNSVVRYPGMEKKVLSLAREYGVEDFVWYSSFLPESLRVIKELEPRARTGILAPMLEDCIAYGRKIRAEALHPHTGGLNVKLPESMNKMPVRAWNDGELFFGQEGEFRETNLTKYAAYGVTDVFTNVPERYVDIDRLFI